MSRLPIRWRLTVVFAVAMTAVLLAAGWFVYTRVGGDLSRALDQQLRSRGQDLSALVRHDGSLRTTTGSLIENGEAYAELLSTDGRVVDATSPIASLRLLSPAELGRARRAAVLLDRGSVPGLDEPSRMLAFPLARGGDRFVLVVGATRENRAETLRSLRDAFLIGGPLALLLACVAGYALAGASLRPIEAMRRRAAEISASSAGDRLPVPPTNDEVSRLGETLNAMLERIGSAVLKERRFVSDASHELRTPLALLKIELELALRRERTPAELADALRSAAQEADRLARIADDLLLLARADQGGLPLKPEPTDVTDLLRTVAARFGPWAEPAGRSLTVGTDVPLVVEADRLRLEQALSNLVDNALQHGRGAVTLSAERRNGKTELHVLDEGAGFPPAFLGRAFEPFSHGPQSGEARGSGLGLAIVDTIARAHRGSAHAANRPAGGADVWIELPSA